MLDFKGAAKPLDDIDLPTLGKLLGVGEDHIHMFLDVETKGKGHDEQGRSLILFERHIFYRELNNLADKTLLNEAVKQGLANKRAGGYGKTSVQYGKLERACKLSEVAALRSCSWGLGQVMGFNHLLAGYPTVSAMVLAFKDDEENQLAGAVNFIMDTKLDDELRACKGGQPETCRAFASGYNGSGYRRNNYHVKLADALQKWGRIKDTPLPVARPREVYVPNVPAPKPATGGLWAVLIAILKSFGAKK